MTRFFCREEAEPFDLAVHLAANLIIDLGVTPLPLGRGDGGESDLVLP